MQKSRCQDRGEQGFFQRGYPGIRTCPFQSFCVRDVLPRVSFDSVTMSFHSALCLSVLRLNRPAGCFHKLSVLDIRLTDITGISTAKVLPVRKIKHNAGMQKPGKYFPSILPGIVPAILYMITKFLQVIGLCSHNFILSHLSWDIFQHTVTVNHLEIIPHGNDNDPHVLIGCSLIGRTGGIPVFTGFIVSQHHVGRASVGIV